MSKYPPHGFHMTLPAVPARPDPLPRTGAKPLSCATADAYAVLTSCFSESKCVAAREDAERALIRERG